MLNRIFPKDINNHYRGYKLALWLFIPITFMKVVISFVHIFYSDGGAQISTIPIDTFTSSGAQNVIALLARMGLEQFFIGLLFVIVLFRYRAMIPLMYILTIIYYIALNSLSYLKPLALEGTSGAKTPAMVLMILSISGLIMSLQGKGYKNPKLHK